MALLLWGMLIGHYSCFRWDSWLVCQTRAELICNLQRCFLGEVVPLETLQHPPELPNFPRARWVPPSMEKPGVLPGLCACSPLYDPRFSSATPGPVSEFFLLHLY